MSTSATYKPTEGKREEFRRYLEKSGVMDALTKVLVSLYEEPDKPTDALQYLITKLSVQTGGETIETVKAQLQDAMTRIESLENENKLLRGGDDQAPLPAPEEEQPPADDAAAPPPEDEQQQIPPGEEQAPVAD